LTVNAGPGGGDGRSTIKIHAISCVASFSVGFSVCSRHWHFSLFGGAKLGPVQSPTETLAMQAIHARENVAKKIHEEQA